MSRTVYLRPGQPEDRLRLAPEEQILRKSLDARKKDSIRWVYTVGTRPDASLSPELHTLPERPFIAGFGPAGMFAGLYLARAGVRPVIFERGSEAPVRKAAMDRFRQGGPFSEENNAQFGEGGAGTFSDGKLNTGTHDPRIRQVLQVFYEHGAPESVLYDTKPHLGTDVLLRVVRSIREEILSLGGEILFDTKLEQLGIRNGSLCSVTANGMEFPCSNLILAVGHSARDTFEMLRLQEVPLERKAFSVGLRIEHLQKDINLSQYGTVSGLGAADYKLSHNGVYTFCMCPGGYVFAANSQQGTVCTNGMSYSGRAGTNANSAVLVTLPPEDFPVEGVLGGVRFQEELERKAFVCGGENYYAPAQLLRDFLAGVPSTGPGRVKPTYLPGVRYGSVTDVLPESICGAIRSAIPEFDKKLKGFASPDAVLTAPETRSSSPVRIVRNPVSLQSAVRGLYPCGEGAGYSGGITSSAVDGLRCAEALLEGRA